MQNYASTFNSQFPPSAALIVAPSGKSTVSGYSFLVRLLSFMEYDTLYKTLPQSLGPTGVVEGNTNQALVAAMKTQLKEFLCPNSPRGLAQQNPAAQPQSAGITSYKAMGASTRDSLKMVADPELKPPYGTAPLHPDGAIFPGNGSRAADILDGLSHTIFVIETIDEVASRWMVGKEATLVGLPQKSSPTGTTPKAPYNFFAPPGFDNTWGENSGVTKAGLRTFLSYDFSPQGADAGKYEDPGFGKTSPAYGPSSSHPGVVNCVMGDASVRSISKQIDVANFFFLITKNNSDPFNIPVAGEAREKAANDAKLDARKREVAAAKEAASRAMQLYDTNLDGFLDPKELEKVPGLRAAIKQVDTNHHGKISQQEIADRIKSWSDSNVGRIQVVCRVTHNGKPLAGAKVVFVPEKFLGGRLQSGSGTTSATGYASIASPNTAEPSVKALSPGFYRVEITKDGEKIPAKYNTATTMGAEVAVDSESTKVGLRFDLQY